MNLLESALTHGAIALACLGFSGLTATAHAQTQAKDAKSLQASTPVEETVPALLLSDIHFDPFFDPGKVPQLAAAPASAWKTILQTTASADREARFAALQRTCPSRGEDTSFALLESSLGPLHAHAADAKFAAVSGDLIAHEFQCKFTSVMAHAAPGEYRAFVEKTLAFLRSDLASAIPGVPLFIGLGNNDSDCGDYNLDAHGEFLSAIAAEMTSGFPEQDRNAAQETFAAGGYYSVSLPAPIRHARLLVLNDIFMSNKYATCAGKPDATAADAQIAWLTQQLAAARTNKEKVWVMGHIPPGVDLYSTMKKIDEMCGDKGPKMFLSSQKIADVLVEFSDVVDVAIFAHTHMDEVRVLRADSNAKTTGVAVKMVSSISPINGNPPSFTVARIALSTGALQDFRVFKDFAVRGAGSGDWRKEYDWASTFHEPEFTPAAVSSEIAAFKADRGAQAQASRNYLSDFFVGQSSPLMEMVWPQYVCTLENYSAQEFKACACQTAK